MKTFKQTVSNALKDLRVEAVALGEKMGFDTITAAEDAIAELEKWESARGVTMPRTGRIRAVLAFVTIFDPLAIGGEGDWVDTIDREFAILKRFVESKHSANQRVAA